LWGWEALPGHTAAFWGWTNIAVAAAYHPFTCPLLGIFFFLFKKRSLMPGLVCPPVCLVCSILQTTCVLEEPTTRGRGRSVASPSFKLSVQITWSFQKLRGFLGKSGKRSNIPLQEHIASECRLGQNNHSRVQAPKMDRPVAHMSCSQEQ
jgi:hypothetical protein